MYFAQHYLDCLSQASYLIGDEESGQAVVVDPRRDVADYLADAAEHGLRIVGVVNTHFHADFLAGHLELAQATGAWIGYGSAARTEYPVRHLADGERSRRPRGVALEILHTPGHTPESISVLVLEQADDAVPYGVLTGDALFIGDVGRPDLLASEGVTADELGHLLYESVQHRLMGLRDAVRVFPAHGAGSACGKNLSTERQSTIGEQRRLNYACRPMTEERFLALVTATSPRPRRTSATTRTSTGGCTRRSGRPRPPPCPGATSGRRSPTGAVLLDARDATDFAAGHLRGRPQRPARRPFRRDRRHGPPSRGRRGGRRRRSGTRPRRRPGWRGSASTACSGTCRTWSRCWCPWTARTRRGPAG